MLNCFLDITWKTDFRNAYKTNKQTQQQHQLRLQLTTVINIIRARLSFILLLFLLFLLLLLGKTWTEYGDIAKQTHTQTHSRTPLRFPAAIATRCFNDFSFKQISASLSLSVSRSLFSLLFVSGTWAETMQSISQIHTPLLRLVVIAVALSSTQEAFQCFIASA